RACGPVVCSATLRPSHRRAARRSPPRAGTASAGRGAAAPRCRGCLLLRAHADRGWLTPFRITVVPGAQLGDARLERGPRLLAACGGPGQGVDEETDERGEQDDRGGGRGGAEQRLEQVGQVLEQAGEDGHG